MSQEEIIVVVQKLKFAFSSEIKDFMKKNEEDILQIVEKNLKSLRKYGEINFVLVTYDNRERLAKKIPKVKDFMNKGKLRRPCFLYYPRNVKIHGIC